MPYILWRFEVPYEGWFHLREAFSEGKLGHSVLFFLSPFSSFQDLVVTAENL